jgi:hypothetical protein
MFMFVHDACSPGRSFAVAQMKTMLAHIVHFYDVRFEEAGVRPPNVWFAGMCLPNQTAEVMFRRRMRDDCQ